MTVSDSTLFKRLALLAGLTVLLLFAALPAGAEDMLGVPVYPAAAQDPETTAFLQQSLGMKGAAYRTADPLDKVTAFYKEQKGLKVLAADTQGAMFKSPDGVDITLQNPWMHMSTGKMMQETLISIVKPE